MALITCTECGAQVSDRAPTCPRCGAPVAVASEASEAAHAVAKKRSSGWLWWTIGALAVVLAAAAGVLLWQAEQARQEIIAAQDDTWASVLTKVDDLGAPSEVGTQGTYFVIRSQPGNTCTAAESEAQYQQYVSIASDALGYQPDEWTLTASGITRLWAATECNSTKQSDFAASVNTTLTSARSIFTDLGVPEAAIAQLNSMRGLDGTQEREDAGTAAGNLKVVLQYDGLNGLQVRVERASDEG